MTEVGLGVSSIARPKEAGIAKDHFDGQKLALQQLSWPVEVRQDEREQFRSLDYASFDRCPVFAANQRWNGVKCPSPSARIAAAKGVICDAIGVEESVDLVLTQHKFCVTQLAECRTDVGPVRAQHPRLCHELVVDALERTVFLEQLSRERHAAVLSGSGVAERHPS